ncbi:MAG TPA: YceI family protein [Casimicrobiaceae bacterium]|nr:YceI family protein [Casimicrobiaceae bacterium]
MRPATRSARSLGTHAGVSLIALAALLAIVHRAGAAETLSIYRVDPDLTNAEFAVSHLGLSIQRGHFGRTRGTIAIDSGAHTGRIDFIVDASSIDTGWAARDAFLRGEDMFDTARYPVMRFRSTRLAFDSARLVGVSGELTMHNVTRPVELHVVRLECGKDPESGRDGCGAEVDTTIKRSDFGMNYALGIVGDDIGLSFQVTAFKVSSDGGADDP